MPKLTIFCLIAAFFMITTATATTPTIVPPIAPAHDNLVLVLDRLEDLSGFRSFADSQDPALKELTASGSAQFTETGLTKLKEKFADKSLMIVDLRRESHAFVDGLPISWMLWDTNWSNIGWSVDQISEDEEKRLAELRKEKNITIQRVSIVEGKKERTPMSVTVTSAYTESNIAARDGVGYMRVPVSDHQAPEGAQINQLITLFKTKPASGWIHFHCKAGKGRTAAFLAMWDMLAHAKTTTFEDIMKRQNAFSNYNMTEPKPEGRYFKDLQERLKVLQDFYLYCKNNTDSYKTLYAPEPLPLPNEEPSR